ncbi:MAG: response regulator [Planctomycetes bacterium]|nr:response regulator [Planctomycetota bacterium]
MTVHVPALLIVDDNPCDVELLRDAFTELAIGATFMVAADGVEAITLLKQVSLGTAERPAAILLDLNMPRVNGREVLSYIKATAAIAAIPTIILTSSSSPKDRAECLEKGADAYFTKASTLQELEALARQINGLVAKGPVTKRRQPPASGPTGGLVGFFAAVWSLAGRPASGVLRLG